MNAIKVCVLAATLATGSLFANVATAQQVTVIAPSQPELQIEPVRWRRYSRPYYRADNRPYVYRPYVRPYDGAYPRYGYAYRPYWSGYYYGPRVYYW